MVKFGFHESKVGGAIFSVYLGKANIFRRWLFFKILLLVFSSRAAIWRSFLQRRCKQIAHMATGAVVCALNSNAKPYYVFSEIVDILSDPEDDAKW